MTTLGQKLIPYSLPRLFSGLSLLAALVAGSVMLAGGHATSPATTEPLVQLTGTSPEDLLADTLGSQVSRLGNAVSEYQSSHGLYSARTVTIESLLAENFLTHVPLPPLAASNDVYRLDGATSRITLRLDGSAGARVCEAVNRREDGHCALRKGQLQYWEDVGPTAGGFTGSLTAGDLVFKPARYPV